MLLTNGANLGQAKNELAKPAVSSRLKRAVEREKDSEVFYCNKDIGRTCVCSGCAGMGTGDECCMDAHNMSNIVQGIEIRFLRFKIKQFNNDFELKFRNVIRDNTINYCGFNATRLEDCGFDATGDVSKLVLLKDIVFNKVYESENYTAKIDKYKIFFDLNVAVLVYRTKTGLRKRTTETVQTDAYVSQNALQSIILGNITLIEKELGVEIGRIRLLDPRPREFTQAELAGISIGGIVALLFSIACFASVKGVIT
jgi:hypothetical protein